MYIYIYIYVSNQQCIFTFELFSVGSILDPTINCWIAVSQAGPPSITKSTILWMDVNLGIRCASINWCTFKSIPQSLLRIVGELLLAPFNKVQIPALTDYWKGNGKPHNTTKPPNLILAMRLLLQNHHTHIYIIQSIIPVAQFESVSHVDVNEGASRPCGS